MNSNVKNVLLGAFALATAILAVLVFQLRGQLRDLEQNAATASADRDDAQKKLSQAEKRATVAEKARADLAAESRARPTGTPGQTRQRDPAAAMNALDNPAMQKMMAASMKGSMDQRYAMLFKKLKLSPAALDKLKDLLTEKQMSSMDVMRAAMAQGLNPRNNAAEIGTLMSKMSGEMDDGIRTLLGDDGFKQYQDFNQNSGSYGLLDQVERRLGNTNAPLADAQFQALTQILRDTTESRPAAAGAIAGLVQGFGGPMGSALTQPRITDQTIAAAQSVLSAEQVEVLKQLQIEQQNQLATMQSMRGGSGPDGPPDATFVIPGGQPTTTKPQ